MKKVFVLLMLFNCIAALAQERIDFTQRSPYQYVYRISNKEAEQIYYAKHQLISKSFLHTKTDSFPSNSSLKKNLEEGHYIFVYTNRSGIQYKLYTSAFIELRFINNNRDFSLQLYNRKTGSFITDAKVTLKNKVIPYNNATASYFKKNFSYKGKARIDYGDKVVFMEVEKISSEKDYPSKQEYEGYVAFNKPRYLPGDTVKLKAYILKNGKPVTGKVGLYMGDSRYNYRNALYKYTLSPAKEGAYVHEFVLGDSLKIDKDYYVNLRKKGKKRDTYMIDGSFRLEDYQLNEAVYEAYTLKKNFTRDDTVSLFLKASDYNGLALFDGKANIKIYPSTIMGIPDSKVYVPYQVCEKEVLLDASGITKVVIASHMFPTANVSYKVVVRFSNSNNEVQERSCYFSMQQLKADIVVEENGDSVQVSYMENNKALQAKGMLYRLTDKGDTVSSREVAYPFNFITSASDMAFYFSCKGAGKRWEPGDPQIYATSRRTKDSVIIELSASKKVLFHYELFRNNKKITEGNSAGLSYRQKDVSGARYAFLYNYIYKNDNKSEYIHVYPAEKTMQVSVVQPDKIFPGQVADIKIKVSDFYGKPVKNADLLSAATNAQFNEQTAPELPDFNQKTKIKKGAWFNMDAVIRNPGNSDDVNRSFYKTHGLDTLHYYQLMFPDSGAMYRKYITLKTGRSQFAPFIASKGDYLKIYFIYVDDKPLYVAVSRARSGRTHENSTPWSFPIEPGNHTVRLRTLNAEYTVKDVEIRPGEKLEFSFDAVNFPAAVNVKKRSTSLDKAEQDLQRSMFYFDDADNYSSIGYFFKQGNRIIHLGEMNAAIFKENDSIRYYGYNSYGNFQGKLFFRAGYYYALNDSGYTVKPLKKVMKKLPKDLWEGYDPGELCYEFETFRENKYRYSYYREDVRLLNEDRTYEGRGALAFSGTPGDEVKRVVLNNQDTTNAAVFYSDFDFSSYNSILRNIIPGNYQAMFSNSKGEWIMNEVKISADSLLLQKVAGTPKKAGQFEVKNVDAESFSIVYDSSRAGIIDAGIQDYRGPDSSYFKVYVRKNGETFLTRENAGHLSFRCEDLQEGIYDLFFKAKNGFTHYLAIYGVVLNGKNSAHIVLKLPKKSAPVFHYAQQGKDVPCYVALKGETAFAEPVISRNSDRRDKPVGYSYSSALLDNRYSSSNFYVDGSRIYDREYGIHWDFGDFGSRIRMKIWKNFHIWRPRSSFYRAKYSPFAAKRKFRTVSCPSFDGDERSEGYSMKKLNVGGEMYDRMFAGNTNERESHANARFLDDGAEDGEGKEALPEEASGIRENFSDYAYWQPNLFTNDKGEASFRVKFPDNITTWNTYTLAMAEKKSGKNVQQVLSYKPLMATLSTPRFLLPGDSAYIIGKALNYSDSLIPVSTSFRQNGELIRQNTSVVKNSMIEKAMLVASAEDTVSMQYDLTAGGYRDGEQEKIPVFPLGMEEANGSFYFLENDTAFTFVPKDTSTPVYYTVFNNDIDVLLKRIEDVQHYAYYCNEQMASKLKTLLLEKRIKEKLGQKFSHRTEIRSIINRLDKAQKDNGAWGWWPNSPANRFMSIYVTDALLKAEQEGFKSKSLTQGMRYLKYIVPELTDEELLQVLQLMAGKEDTRRNFSEYISKVGSKKELSTYSKFLLVKVRQEYGIDVRKDLPELMKYKKETLPGGVYFGEHNYSWYDNSSQLSLIAYQVFEKQKGNETTVKAIRNYFFEHSNKNVYRNTYESALILETLLPSVLNANDGKIPQAKIAFSAGSYTAKRDSFPFTGSLNPVSNVRVTKGGKAPLYVSFYQKSRNRNPVQKSDIYEVKTSFEQDGNKTGQLKGGKMASLVVELEAKKSGDFVMIEVPVPAGCSYNEKEQPHGNYEIHREYFKDKVLIFCERLPAGSYTYKIELQPRYEGAYQLNPAKVELMYFPVFYGNTGMKKVRITE